MTSYLPFFNTNTPSMLLRLMRNNPTQPQLLITKPQFLLISQLTSQWSPLLTLSHWSSIAKENLSGRSGS